MNEIEKNKIKKIINEYSIIADKYTKLEHLNSEKYLYAIGIKEGAKKVLSAIRGV